MFQVVAVRGPQFFLRSHTQRARHLRKVAAYHHHRSRSSSCRKPSTSMSLYSSSGASSGATGSSHHQIMRSSGATAADPTAAADNAAAAAAASVNTTPSPAPPPPPRSWTTRKTTSSLPGAQLRLRLVPKKDDFYQHYRQARVGGGTGGDGGGSVYSKRGSKGSSKQLITDYSSGASLSSTGDGTYGGGTGTEECMEMKTPLPPQTRLTMVHQAEVVINQVGSSGGGLIGGRRRAYI